MRYIEKAAYTWEREGITSLDSAEDYLKALEARKSARWKIKAALRIKDREFSATETHYVDNWISMGFDAGAVEIAYDRTILKTGNLAWSYMDKIMSNWHSKGLHTPEDIMEKDKRADKNASYGGLPHSSRKFGAADHEEIKRMERLLDKLKEEE